MARLAKKQVAELRTIIGHAKAAHDYIFDGHGAVCRRGGVATTTLHYTRPDGTVLYEVAKECGSDLCRLNTALARLLDFVSRNEAPVATGGA